MIRQELVLRTPSTCALKVGDLKDLIAAMHRHGFKNDDIIACQIRPRDGAPNKPYFSLVATQVQEPGA